MEQFIAQFLNSMMSEAGIVAVLLLFAVWYQTKELGKSRDEAKLLHGQILQLATGQIATMKEVQNVLEKVIDLTPKRESK